MIPSHCAIFNLDTTFRGRVVYEDNIVYNSFNNIGSHEPRVPVFQLTSYTEDSLTRFQWILGTALQKNLKKRRKVTSIRKKERKIKKRIQSKEDQMSKEISVPAAAEEIQIQETEENKAKRAKKTPLQ